MRLLTLFSDEIVEMRLLTLFSISDPIFYFLMTLFSDASEASV
jgi:hypothetical protein